MSELPDPLPALPAPRRLSGSTRAFLAFAAGTLVALLPMYYFYTARDADLRAAPVADAAAAAAAEDAAELPRAAPAGAQPLAARMTYELSQSPLERMPPPIVDIAGAASVPGDLPASGSEARPLDAIEERPGQKVANARPISAVPPDPRDTTREMGKEASRADYRGERMAGAQVQPNVFEGRDLALRSPARNTRPIGATTGFIGTDAVLGTSASGVAPIGPAPAAPAGADAKATAPAAPVANAIDSRLAATREWLSAAPQTTHTIQIMGSSSEAQLTTQLKMFGRLLEDDKIYVFRTRAHGKPALTVVYGAYDSRESALRALEKLPAAVSANRPVLRTVNGIRAELKQHGIRIDS